MAQHAGVLAQPLVADTGLLIGIVIAAVLLAAWLGSMFAIAADSLSPAAKIAWWIAVTMVAVIAIPVYWVLRLRRTRHHASAAPSAGS